MVVARVAAGRAGSVKQTDIKESCWTIIMKPRILRLALPTIADQLSLAVVGFITIKVVGGLGGDSVAAVVAAERIFFVVGALMFSVAHGTTALIAQSWGAKNAGELDRVLKLSLCVSALIAVALCLASWVLAPYFVSVFDLNETASRQAVDFILVIAPFYIAYGLTSVLGSALRAAGDSITPLKINVFGNIANIILAYTLVYGAGSLPAMGVAGAALANGLAFSLCAAFYLLSWQKSWLKIKPIQHNRFAEKTRLFRLTRISGPVAAELLLFNIGMGFFMFVLSFYGTDTVAAYGMVVALINIIYIVGVGSSIATAATVGQQIGSKQTEHMRSTVVRALLGTVCAMGACGALSFVAGEWVAQFMGASPRIAAVFKEILMVHVMILPLMAIEFVFRGAYRGSGETKVSLNISLCGMGVRCVLASLVALSGADIYFVYATLVMDYLLRCAIYMYRFFALDWSPGPVPTTA